MQSEDVTEILNREKFAAWLEKKGFAICGMVRASNCCPIAQYLKEELKIPIVTVGLDVFYDLAINSTPLPAWAKEFIQQVDDSHERGTGISGFEGRDILNALP